MPSDISDTFTFPWIKVTIFVTTEHFPTTYGTKRNSISKYKPSKSNAYFKLRTLNLFIYIDVLFWHTTFRRDNKCLLNNAKISKNIRLTWIIPHVWKAVNISMNENPKSTTFNKLLSTIILSRTFTWYCIMFRTCLSYYLNFVVSTSGRTVLLSLDLQSN